MSLRTAVCVLFTFTEISKLGHTPYLTLRRSATPHVPTTLAPHTSRPNAETRSLIRVGLRLRLVGSRACGKNVEAGGLGIVTKKTVQRPRARSLFADDSYKAMYGSHMFLHAVGLPKLFRGTLSTVKRKLSKVSEEAAFAAILGAMLGRSSLRRLFGGVDTSHATSCSKLLVKPLPLSAQGTFSLTTPHRRHTTRRIE